MKSVSKNSLNPPLAEDCVQIETSAVTFWFDEDNFIQCLFISMVIMYRVIVKSSKHMEN